MARHSTALLELVTYAFCCTCYSTCKSAYATNKLGFDLSFSDGNKEIDVPNIFVTWQTLIQSNLVVSALLKGTGIFFT
jgi:hypothetical protein